MSHRGYKPPYTGQRVEEHGANAIVTREVFANVPPTVEYTLTKKGEKLLPSIVSLHEWGREFAVLITLPCFNC